MNHEVLISLELLEQSDDCLRFEVTIHNNSKVKLLFPYPEIDSLRLVNKADMQELKWYLRYLYTILYAEWSGFTLQPDDKRKLEFAVIPCDIQPPRDEDLFCVEIPAGEYLVWFQFEVGKTYYCSDSRTNFDDLFKEAASERAVVWIGTAKSNRLHIIRT